MQLRLLEAVRIDGVTIPRNTPLDVYKRQRQTYIEKLDAELQTLGWLARFPERIDDSRINRQLLDTFSRKSIFS